MNAIVIHRVKVLFLFSVIGYICFSTYQSIKFVSKDVQLDEVPARVKSLIYKQAHPGVILSLCLNNEDGYLNYKAKIFKNKTIEELIVSPLGQLIDVQTHPNHELLYNLDDLIAKKEILEHQEISYFVAERLLTEEVSLALHNQFPLAEIQGFEIIQPVQYKVVLEQNGETAECVFSPEGELISVESSLTSSVAISQP